MSAPTPEQAVAAWAAACGGPAVRPPEVLGLDDALGRVAAAAVRARRSSPAFPAAAMDGIAVHAGSGAGGPVLGPGDFAVVDTGDPVPARFDTVVKREDVKREDVEREGDRVRLTAPPVRGRHVRPVGEDVAAGELVVAPGRRLGPYDLALLAAAGHTEVAVRPRPVVTILPTGDELRPAATELAEGELADTNSLMLDAQAREAGWRTVRAPILPDEPDVLDAAVRRAAAASDLVLLVAGTSAGRHDHAPGVLARCGRVVARGVAMRPGHPVVLAVVDGTAVMACPGYPVSAALAFDRLARPLLGDRGPAPAHASLARTVLSRAGAREHVRVATARVAGRDVAVPLRRGASVLSALARADGLVTVPAGASELAAGSPVRVEPPGAAPTPVPDLLVAGVPDALLDRVVVACADHGLVITVCEMPLDEAVALAGARGCHAAWLVGPVAANDLVTVDVADVEIGVAVPRGNPLYLDPARLDGARVVAGPAHAGAAPAGALAARSDTAAVDAVVLGHADCAVAATAPARAAGLDALPTGRARVRLAARPDVVAADGSLGALLALAGDRRPAAIDLGSPA